MVRRRFGEHVGVVLVEYGPDVAPRIGHVST